VLCCLVLCCVVLCCFICFVLSLSCLVFVLSCVVLPCLCVVLCCVVLSCVGLSCVVLCLSCLSWGCLVLSWGCLVLPCCSFLVLVRRIVASHSGMLNQTPYDVSQCLLVLRRNLDVLERQSEGNVRHCWLFICHDCIESETVYRSETVY
jgi:hypothetical protein